MADEAKAEHPKGYTRRGFLGLLSLGLAGVAGGGLLLRKRFSAGDDDGSEEYEGFHPEGSIFHPGQDPRKASRDRRWKS